MRKSKTAVRKAHFLLASMTSVVIAGCGGSSGSQEPAPPSTVGQLKVSTTTPGDASNSANRNGPIEVVFDRELNPSTVSSEKIVLQNPIGSIPANVTVAGNKLTLTLPQRLARGTTYSIDAVSLQGKSGETLSGTRLLSFTTTTEREWSKPIKVDVSGSSSKPHISVDSNGNAIAAWRQNDGTTGAIHYAR
ncbi:Ig-like domain-containing protein [Duganella sp. Root336D2]|uniref:Ig-like domain-containing protein n=1 Tax=Duganella sp. Root336D2 TaxID=1736518 RepID=UPI00138F0FCC|nr:Ig-like domain-containing protein [Duganella sp. Root336D2]